MDDVDYLVEDNTMDDFFLSSKKDRVQGKPTFEDDPKLKITEKADHSKMAQRRVQAGNKMQMLGNDSSNWRKTQSDSTFEQLQNN